MTQTNLGQALVEEGDYDGAEELYLQAAAILERHYDNDHVWNKGLRQNLRKLYERWDKPEEAAKYDDRRDGK